MSKYFLYICWCFAELWEIHIIASTGKGYRYYWKKGWKALNIDHDTRLTSAEVGYLWSAYLGETMSVCVFRYFLQFMQDLNIKTLIEHAMDVSQQHIEIIQNIFSEEGIQIPKGFAEDDVNVHAKRLFSDVFCLYYVKNMVKGGLATHSVILPSIFRKDILGFASKSLTSAIELNNEASQVLLEKGLAVRPPFIPYPKEVEFVHKQSFVLEILGKRPLTATEVTNLYANILTNSFGACIGAGFAQVAHSKEVREYITRGKEIAAKHVKIFRKYLDNHSLPSIAPLSVSQDVTHSTEAPFSDKLMMYHFSVMNHAGAGNYGVAISESMRTDLAIDYSRLLPEVLKFSEDGMNIMIRNNWFERPPLSSYREGLDYK